jgi:hypothetical protein
MAFFTIDDAIYNFNRIFRVAKRTMGKFTFSSFMEIFNIGTHRAN